MVNTNLRNALYTLLSLEYNCTPEAFTKKENILTASALNEGRRMYSPEKYFFHMVTTGTNAVVTADECLHPFLKEYIKDKKGHWLFEIPNLLPVEAQLNKSGYTLTQTHHMFLPDTRENAASLPHSFPFDIVWFHGKDEISKFYGDSRFPNAICTEYLPHRPDTTVVCAVDKNESGEDKIVGMAGCSEDAKGWFQIGIDVKPSHRSMGVGTHLVKTLKNYILKQGGIPFYGTSVSNYHSWNIAINCGFRPAWVEIGAQKTEENTQMSKE